jgi:outer membrane immunogenic protein
MLRTILISGLATALLGGAALAADLPTKKAAPVFVPPAPVVTWTGFYIGVNGGYAGDQFKYPFDASYTDTATPANDSTLSASAGVNSSGFLGGAQVGYNWQFAQTWVAGLEADIDASSVKGQVKLSGSANIVGVSGSAGATAGSELDYLGTVRARVGYLVTDQLLAYGTGGLAYGQVKSGLNASLNIPAYPAYSGSFSLSKTATQTGWTLGAGVEYRINKNWTFKTEYLYVDLGDAKLISGGGTRLFDKTDSYSYNLKVHTTDNIVRAGLNYAF